MKIDHQTKGRRTLLFEDGLHVGTIFEIDRGKGKRGGQYQWYTARCGGTAESAAEAEMAIVRELQK